MKYLHLYENHKLRNFINVVKNAKQFSTDAHDGQFRKGGEPYIIHPDSVAKIVHDVKLSKKIAELIAAAYLHDVVEDTDMTLEDIKEQFGDLVMSLVSELTTDEEKLAISGKEEYLIDKMLNMSSWALVIKLADRLHNLKDFHKIMNGDDEKRKAWVIRYATQTKNIVKEITWFRELTQSQKVLVRRIKNGISNYV
jgi:(p)ppGpp synthase/HD superfamily hydrolase